MSSSKSERAMHCESIAFVLIHYLNKLVVYNKELKLR